mmetsp:Transcript_150732/g.482321  ORF Transcript_150732/g.482321 Transcript_150732/m.482321 type:complete len:702 (-) Transcript_150732:350-2455(-)
MLQVTSWLGFGERPFCCIGSGNGCRIGLEVEAENADGSTKTPIVSAFQVDRRPPPAFLPGGPLELRSLAYMIGGGSEQMVGPPLACGNILQLTLGEAIHEMTLSLYVNGFSLTPVHSLANPNPQPVNRLWSPLSLVEKCQVKAMQHSAHWAVFKLTIFRREGMDLCYYFASTGADAYREREAWVQALASAIGNVTLSLFPAFTINVQPIPGKEKTSTRIMAGYLLQGGSADIVTLLYCELHGYSGGKARMAFYTDEWCEHEVLSVAVADTSTVSTRRGAYCTVFGVDNNRFACRGREEKELWLRAVSNIKVKLMFEAPDPTSGELEVFRQAVGERLEALPPMVSPRPPMVSPREPPSSARQSALPPLSARGPQRSTDLAPQPAEEEESPLASEATVAAAATAVEPVLMEVRREPPSRPSGDAEDPPEPFDMDGPDVVATASGRNSTSNSKVPWGRRVDDLEPEECRRLLRSVSAKIRLACEGGEVPAEVPPDCIPTSTRKPSAADAAAGPALAADEVAESTAVVVRTALAAFGGAASVAFGTDVAGVAGGCPDGSVFGGGGGGNGGGGGGHGGGGSGGTVALAGGDGDGGGGGSSGGGAGVAEADPSAAVSAAAAFAAFAASAVAAAAAAAADASAARDNAAAVAAATEAVGASAAVVAALDVQGDSPPEASARTGGADSYDTVEREGKASTVEFREHSYL